MAGISRAWRAGACGAAGVEYALATAGARHIPEEESETESESENDGTGSEGGAERNGGGRTPIRWSYARREKVRRPKRKGSGRSAQRGWPRARPKRNTLREIGSRGY